MAVQVQLRRGNTSQHSTFTGAESELTVNTEKDIIVVHDGVTAGGHEVARVNNPYFNGNVDFSNATFSSNLIPSANITYSLGSSTKRWANLYLSGNTIVIGDQSISSNSTTLLLGNTIFSGALSTANALNVGGDVTITGNLIVTGTTLTVNTTTLDVKDLNITVAKGAANSAAADGAGLTIDGANATLTYVAATNTFNLSNYLKIGNSSVNTTINATSFTGDSATVGGNTASNLNTYADNKAANAYSNAVSYTDGRIIDSVTNTSIVYAASANSVKNAYDRAIDANTRAASAQTEASNAYTNAVAYANSLIIDSVTNTSITYVAAANSVKNAYDRAIDANTRAYSAQTEATNAYSNAAIFASNATNVNTGTLAEARLPHRMNQNVRTTDSVSFNDVSVTGNLTISGNTLIVGANNLVVSDAIISLHTPANLAALTSNDGRNIGLAFHYYDTEDKHALLYRDNTTGYLQYHTDGGDPISNSNPTGNNFGTIQAAIFFTGNSTINTAITAGIVERTDVIDTFISNTTTTTTQTAIDSFSATTFRSGKYIIQATNSTNYHYTEVSVVHDGTTAYATEFATMFTGSSLVSFDVDISGGNVRLLATATNATLTTYKIDRKLIKV